MLPDQCTNQHANITNVTTFPNNTPKLYCVLPAKVDLLRFYTKSATGTPKF